MAAVKVEAKEEEAKQEGKQAGEEKGEKAEKEAGEEAGKEVAGKEAGKGLTPKQRRQRQHQKQQQKQHAAAGGVKVKAFEAALKRRAQKGEVSLLKKHRPPQKGKGGKPRRPQGRHRAEEEDDGLELGAVGAVGEFEEQEGMDPGLDEEMDGEVDAV